MDHQETTVVIEKDIEELSFFSKILPIYYPLYILSFKSL